MEFKAEDMDRIFNGAGTVVGASKSIYDAFTKDPVADSRRSMGGYGPVAPGYPYPEMSAAPCNYGYGYADNNFSSGMMGHHGYPASPQNAMMANSGYAGFTNPAYGGGTFR